MIDEAVLSDKLKEELKLLIDLAKKYDLNLLFNRLSDTHSQINWSDERLSPVYSLPSNLSGSAFAVYPEECNQDLCSDKISDTPS